MPALRRLVRNLYMRGVYGNEMAQMVAVDGDLSLVNYVIDNVMYENKVTLTVDSTSKTITMKLAAVSGVIDTILANTEFKIPANLLADEERYGVNATTAVTTVANSREEWMASPPSLSDETYLFFGMEHAPAQGTVRVQKHSRFVNGQDFCDVLSLGKRKIKTFTRTRAFEDLLQAMRDHMGLSSADNLVEKIQGGTPSMQGTWMHPSLVWHVAAWISPVFAVAAMDWADAFYNAPAAAGQRGCMAALTHRLVAEVERQPVYQCEADVRDRVAARIQGQAEAPVGQTGMRADVVSHSPPPYLVPAIVRASLDIYNGGTLFKSLELVRDPYYAVFNPIEVSDLVDADLCTLVISIPYDVETPESFYPLMYRVNGADIGYLNVYTSRNGDFRISLLSLYRTALEKGHDMLAFPSQTVTFTLPSYTLSIEGRPVATTPVDIRLRLVNTLLAATQLTATHVNHIQGLNEVAIEVREAGVVISRQVVTSPPTTR
eukprot:jgi/Mesvir1/26366/Mv23096-RA.1